MKLLCKTFLLLLFLAGIGKTSTAQTGDRPKTDNTDKSVSVVHKKEEPPRINYHYIYKKNSKGLLLGNKCVEDFTEDMGIRYIAAPKDVGVYQSEADRLWQNFKTKTSLFFTKGPFWKFKINKARKKCKALTADFVG